MTQAARIGHAGGMNHEMIPADYAHAAFVPPQNPPVPPGWLGACAVLLAAGFVLWLSRGTIVRLAGLALGRALYRVRTIGAERMPAAGGVLLVANHVSYVDALILSLASPRPVRFLSHEGFFRRPVLGFLLRAVGAIPVSNRRSKDAIRTAVAHLKAGEAVCIFPEGQLTRTGSLLELKRGYELIARQAGCPVLPVVMDGLWGSIFSFEGGRYFTKWPARLPRPIRVAFGECLAPDAADPSALRQAMSELGAAAFAARPELDVPLHRALLRRLAREPFRVQLSDFGMGGRRFRRVELLACAIALGRRWRREIAAPRAGVVLPPGFSGTVGNLALLFAGKTPVNLNPTSGAAAFASCLEAAGLETIITSPAVEKRFPDLPWAGATRDIAADLAAVTKTELRWWTAAGVVLPAWLIERIALGAAARMNPEVILFTSGSSGKPKGVCFSGRNLLTNVAQVAELNLLRRDDVMLCSLPLFHSFGLTVGMLMPLLNGQRIVTTSSPFDYDRIAKAAACERATTLLATPAFLKGYVRKIPEEAFATLRCIVTGAEKLPGDLAACVAAHFGVPVLEGYGLTEASPGAALNQLDPANGFAAQDPQVGGRAGAVGRFVPGLAYRLLDPETGEPARGNRGLLALRGGNVVTQYLGGHAPADRFCNGWFLTGDVVSVDDDGFVQIEGRLSRFSKIGGEMVPHGAIEEAIARCFGGSMDHADCVVGLETVSGEEELVLLTTRDIDRDTLRRELRQAGLPNLWIPKIILTLDALPVLASGKLDLAGCRRFAAARAGVAMAA